MSHVINILTLGMSFKSIKKLYRLKFVLDANRDMSGNFDYI